MHGTICVVEDDPFIRLDAVTLLEDAGFCVVDFATVDDATDYIGRHAPDVTMIFTDVQTPGTFDGVNLANIVAICWPWVQVLVTSGNSLGRKLPARATFMPKPWSPEKVLAHIASETAKETVSE